MKACFASGNPMTTMQMTKTQMARFAREARRLAMDIVAGRAPPLGVPYSGPRCCAIGRTAKRAAVNWWAAATAIGPIYHEIFAISRQSPPSDLYVFPLLSLADDIEAAPLHPHERRSI